MPDATLENEVRTTFGVLPIPEEPEGVPETAEADRSGKVVPDETAELEAETPETVGIGGVEEKPPAEMVPQVRLKKVPHSQNPLKKNSVFSVNGAVYKVYGAKTKGRMLVRFLGLAEIVEVEVPEDGG